MEAVRTEETSCDEYAAQPFPRVQAHGLKSRRGAAPRGTLKVTTTRTDKPGEECDFELQLRSTLA